MGHECRIVVKTKDNKRGKRFIFKDGKFSSDSVLDQYDAAMVWADAKIAFKAMKKGKKGLWTPFKITWWALKASSTRLHGSERP